MYGQNVDLQPSGGEGGRTTPPTPPPLGYGPGHHIWQFSATCMTYTTRGMWCILRVKCVEVKNILAGFIIVFMSYYVFWLEYPEDLRCTLMHIQTIIYGRSNDTVIQYHLDSWDWLLLNKKSKVNIRVLS